MFLANENFPKPSVLLLREAGFEIKYIAEEFPGISDAEVIEHAVKDNFIILTYDKDYGELIFRYAKDHPPSVVFFREKGQDPMFAGNILLSLLKNEKIKLTGSFTVIEANSIRQRFY